MNLYETYIITAILCGVAAAWIAKEKGRNPVLWFFIGAALNVVIICFILMYSNRKKTVAGR